MIMAVTRRQFAKAIGAAVPFAAASAEAKDEALPRELSVQNTMRNLRSVRHVTNASFVSAFCSVSQTPQESPP